MKAFLTFCSSSAGTGVLLQPLDLLVDRGLGRRRLLAVLDRGLDHEDPGVLARLDRGGGLVRHLPAEDEALVEPPRPPGEHVGEEVEGGGVLVEEGHRLPPDPHGGGGLGLGVEALLAELLRLQGDDRRRLDRPPGDAAEVALEERLDLRRLEVAGEDAREVVGSVVGGEVLLRLGERVHRDVRGPAHHRPLVRARLPEERVELLVVLAERGRLGARAGAPRRRRPAPSRTRGRRGSGAGRTRATPTAPAGCSGRARSRAVWSSVVPAFRNSPPFFV